MPTSCRRDGDPTNTMDRSSNTSSRSMITCSNHHTTTTRGCGRSLRSGGRGPGVGVLTAWVLVVALLLVLPYTEARRPRGRLQGKYKARKQHQPIPGAYISESSKKYYNNPKLHEWQKGNRLKSKMEIDPASQADAGIYECHANNKYAVDTRVFRTTYMAEFTP